MYFRNREAAAALLADGLAAYRGQHPLVLGLPRGAVPMARVIAETLDGDLDVVLVRKLRAPEQPELAIGAVDEAGHVLKGRYAAVVPEAVLAGEVRTQMALLRERRARYTKARAPIDPTGRVVILVDDGIATGSSMLAAIHAVRARGPRRVIVATPVAAPSALAAIREAADDVLCLSSPESFMAVGQFYDDFSEVTDEMVVDALSGDGHGRPGATARRTVRITLGDATIEGDLAVPARASGLVIFAHGSGSSRFSERNRFVARTLEQAGYATLLLDLLTPAEEADDVDGRFRFDIPRLARRVASAVDWAADEPELADLPIACFGASTGAAAALIAAAERPARVRTVVSRGGRPDLADAALPRVHVPTLLIVGDADEEVLDLDRAAARRIAAPVQLAIVPGATHLFEEPGALEQVASRAVEWCRAHLVAPPAP